MTENRETPAADSSRKVIDAANLGIAAAHSPSPPCRAGRRCWAEGIHSAVDTGNERLLLVGEKSRGASRRAPPFRLRQGHVLPALIVALSVSALGGRWSIHHGIHSLREPPPLEDPFWNDVMPGVAFVFEGYSWNVSRRALNSERRPGSTLRQTVKGSRDASVSTMFSEDTAALLGIVGAAPGISPGRPFANP